MRFDDLASRARVFQSDLKTDGGESWMVHVASSWRSYRDQVEDRWVDATDYVGPCYPCFAVFFVLCPSGILVF
jgi:hypothetical protein